MFEHKFSAEMGAELEMVHDECLVAGDRAG
jgi:hypothetical protein